MLKSHSSLRIVFLVWLLTFILVFLYYNTERTWILLNLIYGYLLLISFGLTKFYEKQSLKERFGFQRKYWLYWLIMFISICVGVVILYYFNKIYDINVIGTSFFAPFAEEVFFRGYMLGALSKTSKSKSALAIWLVLTSILFSLTHIFSFIYDYGNLFLERFLITTAFGMLDGLMYVVTGTVLSCFAFHVITNILVLIVRY